MRDKYFYHSNKHLFLQLFLEWWINRDQTWVFKITVVIKSITVWLQPHGRFIIVSFFLPWVTFHLPLPTSYFLMGRMDFIHYYIYIYIKPLLACYNINYFQSNRFLKTSQTRKLPLWSLLVTLPNLKREFTKTTKILFQRCHINTIGSVIYEPD